jgi:hypothetical protein
LLCSERTPRPGVVVPAIVVDDARTIALVEVPSSVAVEVATELVEEMSGVGNVEVDTIGGVDDDDVTDVSDEVAVSTEALSEDESATSVVVPISTGTFISSVDTDELELTSGALTAGVVLVVSSVDVATCAKTPVTIAGATNSATNAIARAASVMR